MAASNDDTEPFPTIESAQPTSVDPSPGASDSSGNVVNRPAASSSFSGRLRGLSEGFEQSDIPEGFFAATGSIASSILSLPTAARHKADSTSSPQIPDHPAPTDHQVHVPDPGEKSQNADTDGVSSATAVRTTDDEPETAAPFANGYHFPPRHTAGHSTKLGIVAFWRYFKTPLGFCVTIYGLNVVAWGGMLFLLLCNASPAMCHPTCNDIDSPRRKWIEYDSQILNALFCVTGFGLAPWRFRDLYFLLQYRVLKKEVALRRLAGINRGWFRLPGSTDLPVNLGPSNLTTLTTHPDPATVPYPESKIPDAPLTGVRARATKVWKLDVVIWLMVWNTFFQACLAGFMWAMNRKERPSWTTGLFIALAFGVAGIAGFMTFLEGKAVKAVEGVPVSDEDMTVLQNDREKGIWHYNNIKGKDLTEKEHGRSSE